ncbi:hypothetical protein [Exiguobacterium sp. 17-1]|uniref:hypothetical protein n=1 Tax=Exiguobacterium sp. 17-1 TaxID=2931981 RepID=UPI0020003434|nr:hypothetical protein [Exiguobacterium sp. 17-1]MCK2158698.1 hypothetical protein [Exiguobacterium sp. 17-1]
MRNVLIPTGGILSGSGLYMALEGYVPALFVTGIIMLFGCGITIMPQFINKQHLHNTIGGFITKSVDPILAHVNPSRL